MTIETIFYPFAGVAIVLAVAMTLLIVFAFWDWLKDIFGWD